MKIILLLGLLAWPMAIAIWGRMFNKWSALKMLGNAIGFFGIQFAAFSWIGTYLTLESFNSSDQIAPRTIPLVLVVTAFLFLVGALVVRFLKFGRSD